MLKLFVLYALLSFVQSDCDSVNGPAGGRECVLLEPYYHKYQWATCLTDQYIRTFSKGKHHCRNIAAVYCYYQCMIEIHNDGGSGPVFPDCACGKDAAYNESTTQVPQPSIPSWCFSPSGENCNWYRECLEKRYPCKAQGNSYALDFAEKVCTLYTDNYQWFDNVGQIWVDAVRKCLQVQLVPILRPFFHKTCDEIKEMAFNFHSDCYLNPDNNAPSICQIGVINTLKVFWTVKSSLLQEPLGTLEQMFCVALGCNYVLPIAVGSVFGPLVALLTLTVKIGSDRHVYDVSDEIASQMNWPDDGIMHFAYTNLGCSDPGRVRTSTQVESAEVVHILIAARSDYDLNARNVTAANVTEAAIALADAIQNGDLDLENGTEIQELNICMNMNCTRTSRSVTPPPQTTTVTSSSSATVTTAFKQIVTETSREEANTTVGFVNGTGTTIITHNISFVGTSTNDHISTGSIVGIVFGCIFAIACIVLIIVCLFKRRSAGSIV